MIVRRAFAVLVLALFAALAVPAQDGTGGGVNPVPIARLIAADGYAAVASEVSRTGSYLGLAPVAVARAIDNAASLLSEAERETLLLMLLSAASPTESARRELVEHLAPQAARFTDWSLVAAVLSLGAPSALPSPRALLDVADRIVRASADPAGARPGYEPAAVALAASVISRDGLRGERDASPAVRAALAELLRLIARASRWAPVVESAREAASLLLRAEPRAGGAN